VPHRKSVALFFLLLAALSAAAQPIRVSPNHRFLQNADGTPFFWLADTGWLMFQKLDRDEVERYLEDRRQKGFTVIQAMVIHAANDKNVWGSPALVNGDPGHPTPGSGEHDYWQHIDWIVDRAAEKGIYIGMVAAWGSLASGGQLNDNNAAAYARFLGERYKDRVNIVWILGGDVRGDRNPTVWNTMGRTLKQVDANHLVTYHPFGRTQSSMWFHKEPWLDFDMFQSGHQRYDQDPNGKGEDNWRYVRADYALDPPKPTVDAEPSYEGIPQGLHDTTQPYWTAADARRYGWWSVLAGAMGYTYGNNAVMQFYKPNSGNPAYGAKEYWTAAIDNPGAGQVQYLKSLMLSRPYFDRVYDPDAVAGNGERYDRVVAARGANYLYAYTYTGRPFTLEMGRIPGAKVRASFYNPRDGKSQELGTIDNRGRHKFSPPGTPGPGNDWVLILDSADSNAK
jgi:hypothetical protein